MPETPLRLRAVWLVLSSIISVQVGASAAKGLFSQVTPLGAVWLRLAAASLFLLPVFRPWRALPRRGEDDAPRRWWLLNGFCVALLTMNTFVYLSFSRLPVGVAVTIEFLGPLGVAVAGSRRGLDLVWAALAGLGVALLGFAPGGVDPWGVFFALVAATGWAGYILVGGRLGDSWRGVDVLALSCAVGAVLLAPVAVASGLGTYLAPTVLPVGFAVGLLSTVVPYTFELHALRHLPTSLFGILMSVEPAVAALAALVLLGERLRPGDVVAMVCVILASMGATWTARRRRRTANLPAPPGDVPPATG